MAMTLEQTTFNSDDASALARWWGGVLGVEAETVVEAAYYKVVLPGGSVLSFQQVPDPTSGTRRLHLDFSSDDLDAEVTRLQEAGASEVRRVGDPGGFRWVTLTDPDGNEFCVSASS